MFSVETLKKLNENGGVNINERIRHEDIRFDDQEQEYNDVIVLIRFIRIISSKAI